MRLCVKSVSSRADRRAEAGFTLVEMLVVIAIIGLIMGLVGPRVLNYLGESKVKAAKLQIESFSSSLDLFYLDVGRYPTGSEGLSALAQRPGNTAIWNGPYLNTGAVPTDPSARPARISRSRALAARSVGSRPSRKTASPRAASCRASARPIPFVAPSRTTFLTPDPRTVAPTARCAAAGSDPRCAARAGTRRYVDPSRENARRA